LSYNRAPGVTPDVPGATPPLREDIRMQFEHSRKVVALRERLCTFMREHVYPNEERYFAEIASGERFAPVPIMEELKARARATEFWNIWLPDSEYGQGLTNLEYAPLCEIMGRSPIAPEVFNCSAPDTGNMEVLVRYGTPEQKARWLTPLLEGRTRSAFGMTEIEVASSDATNIETRIERDGDEYVINGRKWFTHNVPDPRCDLIILMGKTDPQHPDRHKQQSMIIVPYPHPGVIFKRLLPIMGFDDAPHGYPEVVFDDVRVPAANMLLGEGRGFEIAQGRLGPGRIHHCMRLIGLAERALERMCRRLATREAFGSAISTQSVWKERIAESRISIEQARLLTLKAAWMMDTVGNKAAQQEIAMIKVAAPNMACKVIDWAMQAFGGAGMTEDYGLPLAYAWARLLRIADGPDEVHRNHIARLEFRKYDGAQSPDGASAHVRPVDRTPAFDPRPRWIV
jgi:acyl-CoA dehydrogenase